MSKKKTLTEIADEIIVNSEGAFSIALTEEYEDLDLNAQTEVDDLVGEQIQSCGCCGWYWHVDSMEESSQFDELICYKCVDDEFLKKEIQTEGKSGNCSYCKKKT